MTMQSLHHAEFEGRCAFALSLGKKGVAGKESCHTIKDGKKYLFSNPVAKFLWLAIPGHKKKSEETWGA